jgi:integrase
VRCAHFTWRLVARGGKWYADGRSNTPNAGRHSLGAKDKDEAIRLLPELDRVRAEDLGLIPRSTEAIRQGRSLPLEEGRRLYEKHIARPRVTGGTRKSTQKRYRTVFDKFSVYAASIGVTVWNGVTAEVLTGYAGHLEGQGYAHKTLTNELTTLKQAFKWLIKAEHLAGMKPIELKLRKAESESPYCYRPQEVMAMVEYCRARPSLKWLCDVVIALACTGLRIAGLASLRWPDIDFDAGRLKLTDETGRPLQADQKRRELKSGRSRTFPIHRDLMVVLKGLARQDTYVFHGPSGWHLTPSTVRRILVREVIEPLAKEFPTPAGQKGFRDGRLHSFRHYFCSFCANNGVPERMVMDWLGHADSEMIRHYYHLHDEEAQRRMDELDFLGGSARHTSSNDGQTP